MTSKIMIHLKGKLKVYALSRLESPTVTLRGHI